MKRPYLPLIILLFSLQLTAQAAVSKPHSIAMLAVGQMIKSGGKNDWVPSVLRQAISYRLRRLPGYFMLNDDVVFPVQRSVLRRKRRPNTDDLVEISQQIKSDYIVSVYYQEIRGNLRTTVVVFDGRKQVRLGKKTIVRKVRDLPLLAEELTAEIVSILPGQSGAKVVADKGVFTSNLEAMKAFSAGVTELTVHKNYEKALQHFDRAVTIDHKFVEPLLFSGEIYLDRRDYAIAAAYFDRVQAQSPSNWRLQYNLGKSFYMQGDKVRAVKALQQATKINAAVVAPYVLLAEIYISKKRMRRGMEVLKKALELDPSSVGARYRLAKIYIGNGNNKAARKLLESILLHDATHRGALNASAVIYLERAQMEKALAVYQQLNELYPQDTETLYSIGQIYELSGNNKEAINTYQSYIRYSRDPVVREQVKARIRELLEFLED